MSSFIKEIHNQNIQWLTDTPNNRLLLNNRHRHMYQPKSPYVVYKEEVVVLAGERDSTASVISLVFFLFFRFDQYIQGNQDNTTTRSH